MIPDPIAAKIDRLRSLLTEYDAAGILLTRCSNFAWLTGGRDNHVRNTSDLGASSLLVTADKVYYVGNNIERPRVEAEELAGLGFEVVEFAWHAGSLPAAVASVVGAEATVVSDNGAFGTANVESAIAPLRYQLDADERANLIAAGVIARDAIAAAARAIHPGMSEHAVAGELCREVVGRGAFPAVSMVAADDRILRYRHPIATERIIDNRAMIVLCCRFRGLIASCTRLINLGPVDDDLRRRHEAVCRVDAVFQQRTIPGRRIGELIVEAQAAYAATGFADEWTKHHQGGATGYETRDYLGLPGSDTEVLADQAFAWNPTITGTKCEGTLLTGADGNSIVTEGEDWPMIEVEGPDGPIMRPDILVLDR